MTSSQIQDGGRLQAANMKIVMSAYLTDKWSDYDDESDCRYDKNDLTKILIF